MHLEYTTYIRGVDVADQLHASYTCQTRSYKWWHRVFFFLIDTSIVNMYIIYMNKCKQRRPLQHPMTLLQFQTQLCKGLTENWLKKSCLESIEVPRHAFVIWHSILSEGHVLFAMIGQLWLGHRHIVLHVTTKSCVGRKVVFKSTTSVFNEDSMDVSTILTSIVIETFFHEGPTWFNMIVLLSPIMMLPTPPYLPHYIKNPWPLDQIRKWITTLPIVDLNF